MKTTSPRVHVVPFVELLREAMVLSGPCWLNGIKCAVSVLGIGSGRPVSPLEPADVGRKQRIAALRESDREADVLREDRP